MLLAAVLTSAQHTRTKFVTWGWEDYDYDPSVFVLEFPKPAHILRVEGFVSASALPHTNPADSAYIRQSLIACRPKLESPTPTDGVQASLTPPNDAAIKRWEVSVTVTPIEINIKQQGSEVIHLPVNLHFNSGEVAVGPSNPLVCSSELVTHTGNMQDKGFTGRNGESNDNEQCLDVEVHWVVRYQMKKESS